MTVYKYKIINLLMYSEQNLFCLIEERIGYF